MTAPVFVPTVAPCRECEEQAVEHLDEDWALPCETSHTEPRRAEWIVTWSCACPPPSVALCMGCKDGVMGAANIVCDDCQTMFVPGSTAIRLIEPLNRRPQ